MSSAQSDAHNAESGAGAHSVFRRNDGLLECCSCDLSFGSYEAARMRPCVTFGAW